MDYALFIMLTYLIHIKLIDWILYVDSSKKWVFSRYDGQFPIPEMDKVELRITKQVGTRLTCSDVLVNGEKIADMYFSWHIKTTGATHVRDSVGSELPPERPSR